MAASSSSSVPAPGYQLVAASEGYSSGSDDESSLPKSSSLSDRWAVDVVAALPMVGMTALPCGHPIPLGHLFSEIQRRIGFLSAVQSFKRQVEMLPNTNRGRRRIDFNQQVRDNQPILCFCGKMLSDFRLIVPKHLTEQGSEHPAARMERARLEADAPENERPELERADGITRQAPIDEIALAKAVMLLEQLKKLIDHFNGVRKMSDEDLQRSLKYVYDRAIKPHPEAGSSVPEQVSDPTLALVEHELEVVVEENDAAQQNPQMGAEPPALAAQRDVLPPFDRNNCCLELGDGLTCNLYSLCQPDPQSRLNTYLSAAVMLLMCAGIIFILFYPVILGDTRLEDPSSNSTVVAQRF